MLHEAYCEYEGHTHDLTGRVIVAVSGSRAQFWSSPDDVTPVIGRAVEHLWAKHGDANLFFKVGDANGVDQWAIEVFLYFCVCFGIERADWRPPTKGGDGSLAGHIRNGRVVDGADMLLAFCPGGRSMPTAGTGNAIYQAERRGIPVHEWRGKWLR